MIQLQNILLKINMELAPELGEGVTEGSDEGLAFETSAMRLSPTQRFGWGGARDGAWEIGYEARGGRWEGGYILSQAPAPRAAQQSLCGGERL